MDLAVLLYKCPSLACFCTFWRNTDSAFGLSCISSLQSSLKDFESGFRHYQLNCCRATSCTICDSQEGHLMHRDYLLTFKALTLGSRLWRDVAGVLYRRTWRRSIGRFWANLSHHRLHPATKVSISLMNLVTAVMVPCLNILMSGVCFGHNLWYVCGNYQVAGIEDSQSKQGTVLECWQMRLNRNLPSHFASLFLECCCSKVEGALEHARQEKEKLGAWCAQLG